MTDGIISGAGTSRNFKVPANAKALYPIWDAALDAMIAGTFTFDLYGINPAGWDVVGDKLGKETLLTDALCTALGLPTTATPTQAMDKMRTMLNSVQSLANGKAQVSIVSYVGTGKSGVTYPSTITFPFAPKIIIHLGDIESSLWLSSEGINSTNKIIWLPTEIITTEYMVSKGFSRSENNTLGKKSVDGRTFSWYSTLEGTGGAVQQYNRSQYTYYFCGIG